MPTSDWRRVASAVLACTHELTDHLLEQRWGRVRRSLRERRELLELAGASAAGRRGPPLPARADAGRGRIRSRHRRDDGRQAGLRVTIAAMFDGRDTIVMFDKLAYEDLLPVRWRPQAEPSAT